MEKGEFCLYRSDPLAPIGGKWLPWVKLMGPVHKMTRCTTTNGRTPWVMSPCATRLVHIVRIFAVMQYQNSSITHKLYKRSNKTK